MTMTAHLFSPLAAPGRSDDPAGDMAALQGLTDRMARIAGAVASLLGLAVLLGWQLHIDGLKRIVPGFVAMNPVTALCFLLMGASLWWPRRAARPRMAHLFLAAVAAIALARLCDLLLGTSFGADRLLFAAALADPALQSLGGMATGTALSFLSLAGALFLLSSGGRYRVIVGQLLVMAVALIALMAVAGYVYGAVSLYGLDRLPMAIHTAFGFAVLALGILSCQGTGPMASFKSPLLGGQTARRMLPLNIGFPLLLGLVCVYGFSGRQIGIVTALSLFVIANITVLIAVTGFAARRLDHLAASLSKRTDELEQARIIADTANKTKSNFLANMSHEMRTPMNGILGMLEILGYTKLEQDQQRIVGTIRTSARTLLDLLNDILDFSKIEANQLSIEQVDSDVAEIIESAGKLFLGAAAAKGITLRCFIGPHLRGPFQTDPVRLRQIIGNLISNAVKFTSEGTVTIFADIAHRPHRQAMLRMAVEDTGVGMSEETRARLFRPFVQADDSTARRFGGTGLGLSICLKLVKLMGGAITLDSILGAGSRVTVELPMAPAAELVQESATDLAGVKVLVIAPDEAESGYLTAILDYWNAKTVAAPLEGVQAALPDCNIVVGPLAWEEKIRAAVAATGLHDDLRHYVFYSFEDIAQDRQSGLRDALYTTALSRARVVTAVAVAAGRKSPEVEMVQSVADRELGISPVSREAALASGQLILLAEDHPVNRDVILRQLRLLGYAADAFENGVAALAALKATSYALVLTDCNMPEMDGFALTSAIRDNAALRKVPIVALTANAMAGESQRCLSAGMDAYLSKPVSLSDLRACLGRWMPQAQPARLAGPEPAAPAAAAGGAMDLSLLRDCFGDDQAGLRENLFTFLTTLQEDMRALADAIRHGDEAAVKQVAHRVKGAAKFVGGAQLAAASEALEASAAGGHWPGIHQDWPVLADAERTISLEIQNLCMAG